tara:strand:- start:11318 stop:11770 length:453 start_codon:yes stop_codon:yes gene_type:complete
MTEIIEEKELTSTKPYLVRAFYDWIADNDCTPYIIVDASHRDVVVPSNYVDEGRIILNIAGRAVNDFQMTNDFLDFEARFDGIVQKLYIPMDAIMAIYAHENGRGMVFADDETDVPLGSNEEFVSENASDDDQTPPPPRPNGPPSLRIVK